MNALTLNSVIIDWHVANSRVVSATELAAPYCLLSDRTEKPVFVEKKMEIPTKKRTVDTRVRDSFNRRSVK
jgi:hypothetical protein